MSKTRKVPFKAFAPKPGSPGTCVTARGRGYIVWSAAPGKQMVWAMPATEREGDAAIYLISLKYGEAYPHHTDGTKCCPSVAVYQPDYRRVETPCQHRSHRKEQS